MEMSFWCQLSALSVSSVLLFMESEVTSRCSSSVDVRAAAVQSDRHVGRWNDWTRCPTHALSVRRELDSYWMDFSFGFLGVF